MRLIVREDKIEEKEEGNIGREDSFYRIMGIGMGLKGKIEQMMKRGEKEEYNIEYMYIIVCVYIIVIIYNT